MYPVELNANGRLAVVVGGGAVAARKVESLLAVGATVRIVSPEFVPELLQRSDVDRVAAAYSAEALGSAWLVFACTDDPQVNAAVAADARAAGILCNIADAPEASDFLVPAVLRRGPLTVAVGTGGASPSLAASLRDMLESQLPADSGILVEELQRAREIVRERVADPAVRRTINTALAGPTSIAVFRKEGPKGWRKWFEDYLAAC